MRAHKPSRQARLRGSTRRAPSVIPGWEWMCRSCKRARSLWLAHRFEESVQLFEKAVQKYPQNLVALVDASRALGARFEIAKAETMLESAQQTRRERPETSASCGPELSNDLQAGKGHPLLRTGIGDNEADSRLPTRTSCPLRAPPSCGRGLRSDRRLPSCCAGLSPRRLCSKPGLLRRMKRPCRRRGPFQKLAADDQAHPLVSRPGLDRNCPKTGSGGRLRRRHGCDAQLQSDPEEGGNPLLRESEALQQHLRNLAESLTREHFQRWLAAGQAFAPRKLAVLTSFPRSGTTLLEQVLDSHPGLVSSGRT